MDHDARKMIEQIEKNSNISMDDIYNIAHAIQFQDLSDEDTVRSLVRRLASLANRSISQEKEDQIVQSIIANQIPASMESLKQFFD